jgi:hypothetical protein
LSRGVEGVVRAAFMFDVSTLVESIGEMILNRVGVTRRSGLATINAQGDELDHGDNKAKDYLSMINSLPRRQKVSDNIFASPSGARQVLGAFLDWCHGHGVVAVGGLQTTFDDTVVPDKTVADLTAFYRRHGAEFLVLPNHSQYPRNHFFDSDAHLRDWAQVQHSQALAPGIKRIWIGGGP